MGHKHTEASKEKIRQSLLGNKRSLGYRHTDKAKQNISKALLGNKRSLGYKHTESARNKISDALRKRVGENHPMYGIRNEQHPLWKEEVKYSGIHMWLRRTKGAARLCEWADNTCKGRFEWSNISQEYKRDYSDWQQLCSSHHKKYDLGLL